MAHIKIFDTTLRDGEQSPGVALNTKEKVEIARQLARLGVDVIEAGFPIASEGDFQAVREIARAITGESERVVVAGLARAARGDIERAAEAVEGTARPRIHTFIATSPIHMEKKLKLAPDQVVERAVDAVTTAKRYVDDVEFSAEDAGRSDPDFLVRIFTEAIRAGATTINVPDTVGYMMPWEYGALIADLRRRVPGIGDVAISTHCHDDLGCAVINSLAGIQNGATQVECTINGIGERAGNASLEEIVMALETRKDYWGHMTAIDTTEIYRTSRMVSGLTGMLVPPNKAVVGDNAFAHESGIHQDGVIKALETYEIMRAETVGRDAGVLVMGKHSGRRAFRQNLAELGYGELPDDDLNVLFRRFKDLCDRKSHVTSEDIRALVDAQTTRVPETYQLQAVQFQSGSGMTPVATVRLKTDTGVYEEAATGDGPVDAVYHAIERATQLPLELASYEIRSVGAGKDALGEVTIRVQQGDRMVHGRGLSTDVVEASARAYVDVLNKLAAGLGRPKDASEEMTAP
ncbi:MAG TPA: 2-isopropylmalate synthase [Trueperaceae bacterium]|nr:2-isopropylmalate synthase [Trueperaceae bacterium]